MSAKEDLKMDDRLKVNVSLNLHELEDIYKKALYTNNTKIIPFLVSQGFLNENPEIALDLILEHNQFHFIRELKKHKLVLKKPTEKSLQKIYEHGLLTAAIALVDDSILGKIADHLLEQQNVKKEILKCFFNSNIHDVEKLIRVCKLKKPPRGLTAKLNEASAWMRAQGRFAVRFTKQIARDQNCYEEKVIFANSRNELYQKALNLVKKHPDILLSDILSVLEHQNVMDLAEKKNLNQIFEEIKLVKANPGVFPEELKHKIALLYWLALHLSDKDKEELRYCLELHQMLYEMHGFGVGPVSLETTLVDCLQQCSDFDKFYNHYYDHLFED